MTAGLPCVAHMLARLVPVSDREWVVGDLIEEADDRGLSGARRAAWLACEAAAVAAGFSLVRARGWFQLTPLRDVVAGLTVDSRVMRRSGPTVLMDALLFCGSVAALAVSVEVFLKIFFTAAGF